MAILIDIGNSRIKWRIDDPQVAGAAPGEALANADIDRLPAHWRAVAAEVDVAFVSNVAGPSLEAAVVDALQSRWPAIRVRPIVPARMRHGIVNGYADPARLGPDRWLSMIAAAALVPVRTILVCSFGTATTIDLLTRSATPGGVATFVGGMILPGPDAMGRSLARETARLPARRNATAGFATDTEDAIGAGIVAAQAGAVERAFAEAQRQAADVDVCCVVGGGAAAAIAPLLRVPHREVTDLVLRGLAIVARGDAAFDATTAA